MNTDFSQLGFKIEFTKDGSPTLRVSEFDETMHHSGGAAKETNYIYFQPIQRALALMPEASTCVVGLGLGYIEIAWALAKPDYNATLSSFEINPALRKCFRDWLGSDDIRIYDEITLCLHPGSNIKKIKERLSTNFSEYEIHSDIRSATGNWNIICYDAFSRKISSELWSEEFLDYFFKNCCAPDCVFTSYACTANLRRVLEANGFELFVRAGFSGKKNSTIALRGIFTSDSVFRTF